MFVGSRGGHLGRHLGFLGLPKDLRLILAWDVLWGFQGYRIHREKNFISRCTVYPSGCLTKRDTVKNGAKTFGQQHGRGNKRPVSHHARPAPSQPSHERPPPLMAVETRPTRVPPPTRPSSPRQVAPTARTFRDQPHVRFR